MFVPLHILAIDIAGQAVKLHYDKKIPRSFYHIFRQDYYALSNTNYCFRCYYYSYCVITPLLKIRQHLNLLGITNG